MLEHLDPRLRETLDRLPRQPGVYLLKDAAGAVIYVGKAKSLHARVRSYFSPAGGDGRAFVPLLGELCADIETIVTHNEKEALLVENTLIKKHHPRFNVKLRDDKNFLSLRLDTRVPYPRLEITRRIRDDGARYFGPFHSASDARQTLRIVNRYFQLRTCSDRTMERRRRPCLQCQIRRCLAPCACEVDPAVYAQQVEDVTLFLRGRCQQLVSDLERRMNEAAAALDYELAARLRDQIAAVRSSLQAQRVVSAELGDQDVIGYHREGDRVEVVVLEVRGGKLTGRSPFALEGQELPDDELVSEFVSRYYDRGTPVPRQILLPLPVEDQQAKMQWLAELRGGPVELLAPRRGEKRRLVELALQNAEASFVSRRQRAADALEALGKLQRRLRLSRLPRRIECFDISSHQGAEVVGSMVLMVDGVPQRSGYRRFRIGSPARDDFAAMYEVLSRRLRRARVSAGAAGPEASPWQLPDLIVIDGGRAHLTMARTALRDAGLAGEGGPDLVALAKERHSGEPGASAAGPPTPGARPAEPETGAVGPSVPGARPADPDRPDRVFLPHVKDPIRLRPNTTELFLLSRLRDEAHRFAIGYHRRLRRQRTLRSALDEVPGIGPRRRQALLRGLGSLERVRQASVEELAALPGMTRRAAEAVARHLGNLAASREEP